MANIVYPRFRLAVAKGDLDLDTAAWRAFLLMTNTSALSNLDAEFVDDITTLDEFNGAGYARLTLASLAVSVNTALNQVRVDAADPNWGALSPGSRAIKGALLVQWNTDETDSRPAVWIDQTTVPGPYFPFSPTGQPVKLTFAPEGFLIL